MVDKFRYPGSVIFILLIFIEFGNELAFIYVFIDAVWNYVAIFVWFVWFEWLVWFICGSVKNSGTCNLSLVPNYWQFNLG